MTSIGREGGFLLIDHSASPGIPPALAAQWAAQDVSVAAGGSKLEASTWTCSHCNAVVIKNPDRTRPREVCRKCMHVVCDQCTLWCEPFARLADAVADGKLHIVEGSSLLLPGRA